jgi:hypothetical protein
VRKPRNAKRYRFSSGVLSIARIIVNENTYIRNAMTIATFAIVAM